MWILFLINFSRNILSSITEPFRYIAWSALVYGLTGAVTCASGGLYITGTSPRSPFVMLQLLCCKSDNDQFENRKGFPCFDPNLNHYVCIICWGWTIYREGGFKFMTQGCSKDSVHMPVPRGKEWLCGFSVRRCVASRCAQHQLSVAAGEITWQFSTTLVSKCNIFERFPPDVWEY